MAVHNKMVQANVKALYLRTIGCVTFGWGSSAGICEMPSLGL
ncbi:hypothetical protein SAMN05192541_12243 [Bradyrhizobium arachidis]|nr:hypothetical protein SAMN05192541_12243 [Bradyrhizobium arachidis]